MSKVRDIVVVGASAGGIQALCSVMAELRPDFSGSILVVLHTSGPSALPQVLRRAGPLAVEHAVDGQPIPTGRILIAPPDFHLLVNDHHVVLSQGPKQNSVRPAIDPLFRSAARIYGPRVVGVVLSGTLDDGSAGLVEIKRAGGLAIVQEPREAIHPEMPRNAMNAVKVDHVLPVAEIGLMLNALTAKAHRKGAVMSRAKKIIPQLKAVAQGEADPDVLPPGKLSALTCPECGGTLWEKREGNLLRFRCHTGHSYSSDTMLEAQNEKVEAALWVALRNLKERAALLKKMALRTRAGHSGHGEKHFLERAKEVERQAEVLRKVLVGKPSSVSKQ